MKKIFIVLAMFITCSLFADVIQSESYYERFENPILPSAEFKATYKFTKNLQTGELIYSVSLDADGKNPSKFQNIDVPSFYYSKSSDSIADFEEIYNELKYAIEYVLPAEEEKRDGIKLEKTGVSFYYDIKFDNDYHIESATHKFGTKACPIPFTKIQTFADVIKTVIDKFYEHKKEFESSCFPVKPFSK